MQPLRDGAFGAVALRIKNSRRFGPRVRPVRLPFFIVQLARLLPPRSCSSTRQEIFALTTPHQTALRAAARHAGSTSTLSRNESAAPTLPIVKTTFFGESPFLALHSLAEQGFGDKAEKADKAAKAPKARKPRSGS
jgi:hypothetical protein